MAILELATCSVSSSRGMEVKMGYGSRLGGVGGVCQQQTCVRFDYTRLKGSRARCVGLKVGGPAVKRGLFGCGGGRAGNLGALSMQASFFEWGQRAFDWIGGSSYKVGRRPSGLRVTTSRRPVLEGESSSDEPMTTGDTRDGETTSGTISLDFAYEESLDSVQEQEVSTHGVDGGLSLLPDAVTDGKDLSDDILEELLGGPVRVRQMEQDVGRELEELYDEVGKLIDEGDEDTARELMEANYDTLLEQLDAGVQGVEQAAMLDVLAQLYMNMDEFENAEVLLVKNSELLRNMTSPQPLLDSIFDHVASMYSAIGKPKEAIPLYIQSLDMQKSLYGEHNPVLVTTMLGLAKAHSDNEEPDRSVELYREVLVLMERSYGHEDASLVLPLTHLGHTLLEEERAEEAEGVLQRAVQVTERAYGAGDGRVGVATCALARAKIAQGQVDEAVDLFRHGLKVMEGCSKFSLDDPAVETVRTDLAEILNYMERDSEAQELWEETILVKERVLGKYDIQLVPHLTNAATSYVHSGNFDKSEALYRRALKLMTVHYGPRAPEISIPLEMLATSLHHLGRGTEAESLAREAVSIRESHFGQHHPNTGQAYNCLAAILHGVGKDMEAESLLRKVLRIQERELGSDSPEIILTLELLAMLLNEQERTAELQPIIRRMQKLESILTEKLNRSPEADKE